MPTFDLPALLTLADGMSASPVTLSPITSAIILAALEFFSDLENWTGANPDDGLSDLERDQIGGLVDNLLSEVMSSYG